MNETDIVQNGLDLGDVLLLVVSIVEAITVAVLGYFIVRRENELEAKQ